MKRTYLSDVSCIFFLSSSVRCFSFSRNFASSSSSLTAALALLLVLDGDENGPTESFRSLLQPLLPLLLLSPAWIELVLSSRWGGSEDDVLAQVDDVLAVLAHAPPADGEDEDDNDAPDAAAAETTLPPEMIGGGPGGGGGGGGLVPPDDMRGDQIFTANAGALCRVFFLSLVFSWKRHKRKPSVEGPHVEKKTDKTNGCRRVEEGRKKKGNK